MKTKTKINQAIIFDEKFILKAMPQEYEYMLLSQEPREANDIMFQGRDVTLWSRLAMLYFCAEFAFYA